MAHLCPDAFTPGIRQNRTFIQLPLPLVKMDGRFLNLGSGKDVRPAGDGWVNLDGYVRAPGVLTHDILDTPWPFPDGHFDVVCASHVLEHVPVQLRRREGAERDVLFDVMEEIHRTLKPGGILHVRVPWGGSGEAFSHPQHYRHWRPEWFNVLDPDGIENYYSTARFKVVLWRRNLLGFRAPHALRVGPSRLGVTTHLAHRVPILRPLLMPRNELEIFARAVK